MRFGRPPKPGQPAGHSGSRHRGDEPEGADLAADGELDSYLAAIGSGDNAVPSILDRRFGSAQVYQLRLPEGAGERLQDLADQRGTAPLALIQEWVLQRLEQETPPGR